jgi:hypothetical protein
MRSTTSNSSLVAGVDGGELAFEIIRLPNAGVLGVVRTLRMIGVGLIEMTVLFDSEKAFQDWIEKDEYRHHAPGLMAFVKRRFNMYCSAVGADD